MDSQVSEERINFIIEVYKRKIDMYEKFASGINLTQLRFSWWYRDEIPEHGRRRKHVCILCRSNRLHHPQRRYLRIRAHRWNGGLSELDHTVMTANGFTGGDMKRASRGALFWCLHYHHQNGGDRTSRNGLKLYIKHAAGLAADCDRILIKMSKMLWKSHNKW